VVYTFQLPVQSSGSTAKSKVVGTDKDKRSISTEPILGLHIGFVVVIPYAMYEASVTLKNKSKIAALLLLS
jgi:hypothetical protein